MKVLSTITLIFLTTSKAFSCMCVKNAPIDSTFQETSVIFVGKVKEVIEDKLISNNNTFTITNFEILEEFKKGISSNSISIVTDNSSCSYTFREGKTYVVFGYSDAGGILKTNQCTRTGLYEHYNKADLERLRYLSVNYNGINYGELGLVSLYRPEYNVLMDKMNNLEEIGKYYKIISISLAIILLLSISVIIYMIRNK
ncbi:MAG: hypothetical protein LPK19_07180 [Hymenobacteraceae bacterium]|nr:hypothetical protein [Hymenobacteraceae bacterium]MDX5395986.1 hypothetical protein [Hymenobacteraceae bacterium]MDX5512049.1 hypothetical protein [Hymenobacteraceae bacterium]